MSRKGKLQRFVNGINLFIGRPIIPRDLRIGKNVYIGLGVRFDAIANGSMITIGDNVTIVDGARIICHDASSNRRIGAVWVAPVTIEEGSYIGAEAIILPGVRVGENAIVASGAVVTKNVAAETIVAGVPAAIIGLVRDLDEERVLAMRSKQVFESRRYGQPNLPNELVEEMIKAATIDGGFFLTNKETR